MLALIFYFILFSQNYHQFSILLGAIKNTERTGELVGLEKRREESKRKTHSI